MTEGKEREGSEAADKGWREFKSWPTTRLVIIENNYRSYRCLDWPLLLFFPLPSPISEVESRRTASIA